MNSFSETESQIICRKISKCRLKWWERWLLAATYSVWHKLVSHIINQLYEHRVVDSSRMHIISALFDRTQPDSVKW